MTDSELKQIEARANAATDGPWEVRPHFDEYGRELRMTRWVTGVEVENLEIEDAEFVAHARTDVPALCEEVRRLRKLLGNETT